MADLDRAITAAREALTLIPGEYSARQYAAALRDLLAALDAAPAAAVPEVLVRAYFHRFSEVEDDYTIYHTLDGVCEQCIPVLIVRDDALAAAERKGE